MSDTVENPNAKIEIAYLVIGRNDRQTWKTKIVTAKNLQKTLDKLEAIEIRTRPVE